MKESLKSKYPEIKDPKSELLLIEIMNIVTAGNFEPGQQEFLDRTMNKIYSLLKGESHE